MIDQDIKRKQSFLLRLPVSVREAATRSAHEEGTSLNHFIALAVTEKLSRMDAVRTAVPFQAPFRPTPANPLPYRH